MLLKPFRPEQLLLLISLTFSILTAQIDSASGIVNVRTGNLLVYDWHYPDGRLFTTLRSYVGDTLYNGRTYCIGRDRDFYRSDSTGFYRVRKYGGPEDTLAAFSWPVGHQTQAPDYLVVYDKYETTILGTSVVLMDLRDTDMYDTHIFRYCTFFGLQYELRIPFESPGASWVLRGAVIDGVVYGDTALRDFDVNDPEITPSHYQLHAPYPNPFNMATNLSYDLPRQSAVSLAVYNLQGESINRIVDQIQAAGTYHVQWDGSDDTGRLMPSGIYLVRLVTPIYTKTVKTVLLK